MQWRKGIFINDSVVLFYGFNDQNVFRFWTMHIDDDELSEVTDFPGNPYYLAAFRIPGVVFMHDGNNITRRLDTSYVNILTEQSRMEEMNIYPNPATSHILVEIPVTHVEGIITVSSLTGEIVHRKMARNNSKEQIECTHLPQGVYVVIYTDNKKTHYSKFVKL